ncbi:MAG: hypothetical protein GY855_13320 [candidate division Zixibacteria bacterium]|nr:hypothetical protein [candidate division Zixibacteria bacterium]
MNNRQLKLVSISIFIVAIFAINSFCNVAKEDLVIPQPGKTQILTLEDGSKLVGQITDIIHNEVKFQSDLGISSIAISKIASIKEVDEESFRDGKYWFPNPNQTRLYFSGTARMLKAGEGYLSDVYILFPGFAFGLTDNISIGGGMSIFPGLSLSEQLYYFTPKIGLNTNSNIELAVSGLILRIPNYVEDFGFTEADEDSYIIGLVNIIGTIGSADKSLTAGLGYGFADGELADKPAITIGGEYRFARRLSFVSENWILPGIDVPIVSYGIRFFGESLTVDLAFANILDDDAIFPGIPYLDFVWNF